MAYPGGRHVRRKTAEERKFDVDVHHLVREHGPEAIATLAGMLNDPAAPHMAKIIAANSLLDRGWCGRRCRLRCVRPMRGRRSVREAPVRLSKAALLSLASDSERRKTFRVLN
jgi:hypothetical protein